jgi:hypothetical protein
MARTFWSGFFTTIGFAVVIFVVLGVMFLLTSLLSPGATHVAGY